MSTQRIRDRLKGDTGDDEVLVRAYHIGEFIDQFTTHQTTPEETKATLERLPKCMQRGQRR